MLDAVIDSTILTSVDTRGCVVLVVLLSFHFKNLLNIYIKIQLSGSAEKHSSYAYSFDSSIFRAECPKYSLSPSFSSKFWGGTGAQS